MGYVIAFMLGGVFTLGVYACLIIGGREDRK